MYSIKPGLVLGFHGCDKSILHNIILHKEDLRSSDNDYDWLGHGIYFWDGSLSRAFEYATFLSQTSSRARNPILVPAVLGATLSLGFCLDLLDYTSLNRLKDSYSALDNAYKLSGYILPKNSNTGNSTDRLLRRLDCAVIEYLHETRRRSHLPPFDSVRGVFTEGKELYPNAGFREKDHIQLCIRNPNCIKGYFLPRKNDDKFNKV